MSNELKRYPPSKLREPVRPFENTVFALIRRVFGKGKSA